MFTYSSRSSSDSDGDAPQNADIVDDIFYLWNKKKSYRKSLSVLAVVIDLGSKLFTPSPTEFVVSTEWNEI